MGKQYRKLKPKDIDFIKQQKMFFLASASGKEVNLSPKGYDCIWVLDEETVLYLDFPGSGNRTHRDVMAGGEFTLMFNAFEGKANITKLFCKAEVVGKDHAEFDTLLSHFDVNPVEVRQLFLFKVKGVETSCGDAVPYMKYEGERPSLKEWASKMAKNGKLEKYMKDHEEPPVLDYIEEQSNEFLFMPTALDEGDDVFFGAAKPRDPIEVLLNAKLESEIFHVDYDGHAQVEQVTYGMWDSPETLLKQIDNESKWEEFYEASDTMSEAWSGQLARHFPVEAYFSKTPLWKLLTRRNSSAAQEEILLKLFALKGWRESDEDFKEELRRYALTYRSEMDDDIKNALENF
ncbi:MAG: hypothetical protein GQ531_02915 [Sulfurovum sp.]|nr:hypothetical protein [Sulfurovum sp.]